MLANGHASIPSSDELKQFILTILALQILNIHFSEKKSEWKMIMNKASKWARSFKIDNNEKKNEVGQIEKDIKNMVQAFD